MRGQGDAVGVVVTGLGWAGGGIRSIDGVLRELVASAQRSLDATAYSLTDGAGPLFDEIESRLESGVKVRLIINNLAEPAKAPARFRVGLLLDRFPGRFMLWDFPKRGEGEMASLHAKLVVADRSRAFVGSANLSFHGLAASHELGVSVDGPAAAEVALCVDRLINSRYVVACTTSKEIPS